MMTHRPAPTARRAVFSRRGRQALTHDAIAFAPLQRLASGVDRSAAAVPKMGMPAIGPARSPGGPRVTRISRHFAAAVAAALLLAGQAVAQTAEGRVCSAPISQSGSVDHSAAAALQPGARLATAEAGRGPAPQLGWSDRRGGGKLAITFNATMTAFRGFGGTGAAEPKARRDGEGCASS